MNSQGLSWSRLLSDIQEHKGIRQELIAEQFNCTQQYVSALMKGWRKPSQRICEIILEWATSYNLNLNDYALDESDLNNDIKLLCMKISRQKNGLKIVKSLNAIMDTF